MLHAGIVLARLGAHVILTDLLPNLPLLIDNCKANGKQEPYYTCLVKHLLLALFLQQEFVMHACNH